jgi:Type IV secretion-system coupling protein DNA-binding domain
MHGRGRVPRRRAADRAVTGDWARPSAATPLLRRFGDERARDTEDLRRLYDRVQRQHFSSPLSAPNAEAAFAASILDLAEEKLPPSCMPRAATAVRELLDLEPHLFRMPEPRFDFLNLKEAADLRNFLRRKERFHGHEARITEALRGSLTTVFRWIGSMLPDCEAPSPFTVPLVHTLPNPGMVVDNLFGAFGNEKHADAGLFAELFGRLWMNACAFSGVDPYAPKKPPKLAKESGLPAQELAERYLAGTPLLDFFLAPVPLKFTQEDRFSHMHVLGGSGAGKTTLLQNLILNDLAEDDPPSLVIVDSQGDLISKLSRLAVFDPDDGDLADRFVLITPKDTKHPPAINIFDVNQERLAQYDEAAKEQVVAGVIQTFDYLFSGLLGADLTAKQGVFFRFVARLMLALPETMGRTATILDMLALMDDPAPYAEAIASLPPIQRDFFRRDFPSKTFAQTREQIRYRLNAILENPTLARLFTAPKTKLDFFDALNDGSIILIDTAKDFLKGSSAHFGRLMISLVLQAVLERAALPESRRKPVFLIVDEAAAYFDSNIDDFLTETRKYKCGCVFAHQFLDQATSSLRASLAANTAIKLAGGVSTGDARALAPDMRTTADFILGQPRLHFAAYFRGTTQSAVSIPVQVGRLEAEPTMTADAYELLRESNIEWVCADEVPAQGQTEAAPIQTTKPASSGTASQSGETRRDPTEAASEW